MALEMELEANHPQAFHPEILRGTGSEASTDLTMATPRRLSRQRRAAPQLVEEILQDHYDVIGFGSLR